MILNEKIKKTFFKHRKKLVVTNDEGKCKEFLKSMNEMKFFEGTIQEEYEVFTHNLLKSGEIFECKTIQQSVISQETKIQIQLREKLRKERHISDDKNQEFRESRREANKMIQRDVRKYETNAIENAIKSGSSWKNAKKGINKGKNWIPKLKDENGIIYSDRKRILEIAASYYENLYSSRLSSEEKSNLDPDLSTPTDVEEIEIDEIEIALSSMKNKKAVGNDLIPTELMKLCDAATLENLRKIFNEILKTEEIPSQWLESTIILFFKKGDRTEMKNYRPITKTSHLYKLFIKIISNRITESLEQHQSVNQAGFRRKYSTTDHLFSIQQLMEKCSEHQMNLYLGFIDFEKAFDSIEHPFLWRALKKHGVDNKYIRIMKKIYDNSTSTIEMEEKSRKFKIGRGIKQGCCLSPKQFNGALQEVFDSLEWDQFGMKIEGRILNELRFADDVVLISQDKEDLLKMMESLFDACKKSGLKANIEKTKIMSNTNETLFTIDGKNIEKVEDYKYLGSILSFNDRETKEIQARTAAAWRSFWSLGKFFQSDLPIYFKRRLMDSCILPILTYGCQCWNFTEKAMEKLAVEQRNMERKMMKIKKISHTRNTKMRKFSKITDVTERAKELKWSWAGHSQRLDDNRWAKILERWKPEETRKRGTPQKRWRDEIEEHAGILWRRKTQRRELWRNLGKSFA
jgi:hypothetical protein